MNNLKFTTMKKINEIAAFSVLTGAVATFIAAFAVIFTVIL